MIGSVHVWFNRTAPYISVTPYEDTAERSGDVSLLVADGETSTSVNYILNRVELSNVLGSVFTGAKFHSVQVDNTILWFTAEAMSELLFALEMI